VSNKVIQFNLCQQGKTKRRTLGSLVRDRSADELVREFRLVLFGNRGVSVELVVLHMPAEIWVRDGQGRGTAQSTYSLLFVVVMLWRETQHCHSERKEQAY
jgi:hypothetical protein